MKLLAALLSAQDFQFVAIISEINPTEGSCEAVCEGFTSEKNNKKIVRILEKQRLTWQNHYHVHHSAFIRIISSSSKPGSPSSAPNDTIVN